MRSRQRVAVALRRLADWVEGTKVVYTEQFDLEYEHALAALRAAEKRQKALRPRT